MTTIQLLQKHNKYLLNNYSKIQENKFYRNSIIDLLFYDLEFEEKVITLDTLLNLWKNVEAYISDERIYLVSIRYKNGSLSGTGISIQTNRLEVGSIKLISPDLQTIFNKVPHKEESTGIYVPLPILIEELKQSKTDYSDVLEDVNNSFYSRLHLEAILKKKDITDKVRIRQEQDKIFVVLEIPFDIRESYIKYSDHRSLMRLLSTFCDQVKESMLKFNYTNFSLGSNLKIEKQFNHPEELLKYETIKDILVAVITLEQLRDRLISTIL